MHHGLAEQKVVSYDLALRLVPWSVEMTHSIWLNTLCVCWFPCF